MGSKGIVLSVLLFLPAASAQITGRGASDAISRENRPRQESRVGNSVDAGTGAFAQETEILSIQGGRDLTFNIAYNSLLTQTKGAMGFGWSHQYEAFVDGDPQGVVTVHWDANRKNGFRFAGSGSPYDPVDEAVRYDRLIRNSNGSWTLTRHDGTMYDFEPNGELRRIGNKVFQFLDVRRTNGLPSTIEEPIAGRKISLRYTRDGNNLLQSIMDEEDRLFYFGYDSAGRLAVIQSPGTLGPEVGTSFVPKDIPDNDPRGLTHTISVTRTEPVGLVELSVANLGHTRPQDLTVILVSPSGTQAVIQNPVANPISPSPNPWDLTGLVLDNFNGENPAGTWRVVAIDSRAGSIGKLNGWRMRFTEPAYPTRYAYDAAGQITFATDFMGDQIFANTYDAEGRVVAQDDGAATNMIASISYANTPGGGVRTTYTDRMANAHVLEHDSKYRLLSRKDPLDNTVSFSYNDSGDRTRLTDALGRATVFGYDRNGNLITVVGPALNTTTMTYDDRGNLRTIRDALGKTSTFQYDNRNNLTRVTDALGNSDRKTYNGNSQLGGSLLEDGAGINYSYNSGMPVSANHPADSGSSRTEYDKIGRATQLADADGFITRFKYDSRGNVIEKTDPLGKTTATLYDGRNRVIARTDRRGNITRYEYDGNDNLISTTNPLGQITRYQYDGEDRLSRTIDPRGNVTTAGYDVAGRVIAESNALGDAITYQYDAGGNRVAVFDAKGVRVNRTVFDERNLPVSDEDALGRATSSAYDAVERTTQIADPLKRTTAFKYDDLDRLIEVRDAAGRAASQQYEADDVRSLMADPKNSTVRFRYDPANRLTRIETGRGTSRFVYNGRDLLTRETHPSGRQIDYSYDDAGRRIRMTPSGPGIIVPEIQYSYDDNGNITAVSRKAFADISPVLRLSRSYDPLNRLIRFTDGNGNTVQYSYDAAGNLETLVYPDGRTVTYTYDKANRISTVTDWAGRITRYAYDANGRVTRIGFPNGTSRVMEYDAAGQILRRKDLTPQGGVIVEYRYAYDAAGQMNVEASPTASPSSAPRAASMTYGSDNRLSGFNGQSVAYDSDGNLTRGPLANALRDFDYDPNNNLTSAGDARYFYDEEDRLVGFTAGGRTTRMVVDPRPALSQVLFKIDPSGAITRYVYGIGLIYEESGGSTRTYHYDHRGSTVAFTSDSGAVVGTVAYGAYGEVVQTNGQADSLFQFAGLFGVVTDPNGLNYMRFRWYSPEIKRFLNEDAHFGQIAQISSLNRYSYAGGNPVMHVDPHGEWWTLIGAVSGAVYGVVAQAVGDVVSGQKPDWRNYVGAAIGGAVYGAVLATCPTCGFSAGAASALTQKLTASLLKGEKIDPLQLATTTLIGGVTGKVFQSAGTRFSKTANRATIRFKPITGNPNSLREIFRVAGKEIAKDFAFWVAAGVAGGASRGAARRFGLTPGGDDAAASDDSTPAAGNAGIREIARSDVNRGNKSSYGEFIHWQFYLDALRLAARPVPNNPNNLLTSF